MLRTEKGRSFTNLNARCFEPQVIRTHPTLELKWAMWKLPWNVDWVVLPEKLWDVVKTTCSNSLGDIKILYINYWTEIFAQIIFELDNGDNGKWNKNHSCLPYEHVWKNRRSITSIESIIESEFCLTSAFFVAFVTSNCQQLVGGWTNPIEKYARQIGSWNPK